MAKSSFSPRNLLNSQPDFSLPDELWISVFARCCAFPSPIFLQVVDNLIRNPNISSTHLFRAEIFYDSDNHGDAQELGTSAFTAHMRASYRPRPCKIPTGYEWKRTIVRRFVPRNPQLDQDLVQTVHFFDSRPSRQAHGEHDVVIPEGETVERTLVMQIPHVERIDEIPWYHPTVKQVAIIHKWSEHATKVNETFKSLPASIEASSDPGPGAQGEVSIHYCLFEDPNRAEDSSALLSERLIRTAYNLLSIVYRHSTGQLAGYTKRVHHDLIVPQSRFQDTYTRLKLAYAKPLIANWQEQTDPGKHVFEDLGIAAFLLELWTDMYDVDGRDDRKPPFPGFVDVGCGNGVLVHILRCEGYAGWGFDARRRKTWAALKAETQPYLCERILVPAILSRAAGLKDSEEKGLAQQAGEEDGDTDVAVSQGSVQWHDGVFPRGTFIISNHADELTPWTPVLASLSRSPFVAIPCCSHSFSGARFRAPAVISPFDANQRAPSHDMAHSDRPHETEQHDDGAQSAGECKGGASGSLARPKHDKGKGTKSPSAYAALTAWIARLAADLGYEPEREMLRIPSTRNAAIVGRRFVNGGLVGSASTEDDEMAQEERTERARTLIEHALGKHQSLEEAGREWLKRAHKLSSKTTDAH